MGKKYKSRIYTDSDRRKLDELQTRCDEIVDKLFCNPSATHLASELREIEIKIAAITGEEICDY
jgi:hypothetical protein